MTYRISGLDPAPFRHLYGLSDEALEPHGAYRRMVDRTPGFPDRIELRDAAPGETVLLLNYVHQPANSPFRASHAIFIREGAETAFDEVERLPPAFLPRILSVRAFDAAGMIVDTDLTEGKAAAALFERFLARPDVAYLHAHYAKWGCYAGRVDRA